MGSLSKRKAKVDQTGRNPDKVGSEDRTIITRRSFWHSPHIAALSGAGRALTVELQSMFNGANNGTLFLSVRDAADRLGFTDLEAAQNAMGELESLGLVTITIDSSFAMKAGEASRARAYRLNWIGADGKCVAADTLPPLDFAKLTTRQKKRIAKRSEALGRYLKEQRQRKLSVRETPTLMADSVRETRTEAANSVRETRTPEHENGENPPTPHVRESLTHILHHIPSAADGVDRGQIPSNIPSKKMGSSPNCAIEAAFAVAWSIMERDGFAEVADYSDAAAFRASIEGPDELLSIFSGYEDLTNAEERSLNDGCAAVLNLMATLGQQPKRAAA